MSTIVKYVCDQLNGAEISCMVVHNEPWFKAKDIATILGYVNTKVAIQTNVDYEDKRQYKHLVQMLHGPVNWSPDAILHCVMFINESGLYSLILRSNKADAKVFKRWVTSEVLPDIRKTGSYVSPTAENPKLMHKQIQLLNETDLHYKVIDLIRTKFPDFLVVPGLGELQVTSQTRIDAFKKGYIGGQPDILILNHTKDYNGFAIELKTPKGTGIVHDKQATYLASLKDLKYKTLITCDYDEVVIELTNYFNELRFPCQCCPKVFRSKRTHNGHVKIFHNN
jgi:prophage antirepressor-like protein